MTFDAKLTARHIREMADFDLIRWNRAGFESDVEKMLIEIRNEALKEAAEVVGAVRRDAYAHLTDINSERYIALSDAVTAIEAKIK